MKWSATVPSTYPVTFEDIAKQERLDNFKQADYVNALIATAVEYAETRLGSSLMQRTVTAVFYRGDKLFLPRGPVQSITSVTDGYGNVIDPSKYGLEGYGNSDYLRFGNQGLDWAGWSFGILGDWLDIAGWGYKTPLTVVYVAGYPDAASVPADFKGAIRAHVGTLYKMRESVTTGAVVSVPHSLDDFYRLKSRNTGIG